MKGLKVTKNVKEIKFEGKIRYNVISNNLPSVKGNLTKHQKVSKYYENVCSVKNIVVNSILRTQISWFLSRTFM